MTAPAQFGVTPRMRDCLDAIREHIAANRCSPSFRELANRLNLKSKGRIHYLLTALQDRGRLTFQPTMQRSIALISIDGEGSYALPATVEAALRKYCDGHDEKPSDVVADAVTLFLDERETDRVAEVFVGDAAE
jgi:SOS-response transcriptional repressor LexA